MPGRCTAAVCRGRTSRPAGARRPGSPAHGRPGAAAPGRSAASAGTLALLCGLVAALLLLQTLGIVHTVVHPTAPGLALRRAAPVVPGWLAVQPPGERPAAVSRQAGAPDAAASPKRAAASATLFAGHEAGSSGCALYDQLVQPTLPIDAACSANPAFASPLPADPPRVGQLAPQAVGFLARGPPALSRLT